MNTPIPGNPVRQTDEPDNWWSRFFGWNPKHADSSAPEFITLTEWAPSRDINTDEDIQAVQPAINVNGPGITEAIKAAFEQRALLDAKKIDVMIEGPKVILRGFVSSMTEKDEAERVARQAKGVTGVENHLLIVV